jgi:DNA-binding MltR family transcriptional regulator
MDEQFQKLITENLTIIMNFRRELTKETDRGCALMAASFLDYELEKLLREKLVGSKNHLDTLFEFNGPLGTFSSRIRLSYSLGLIPK